jgi:transcriptional regulator with GAF, ATPase, and Fis domain
MPEQGLASDSVHSSDLTVGQYLNLLDLAQLALSQRTTETFVPLLALRLHHALKFGVVTLGLYDSSAESIRLSICKAGEAERRSECLSAQTCSSGWVWKNQRSVLVQDLDTEPKLPAFLQSLRRLGVHTYYVFPLTTSRHKLGAIGFGSLHVIPKTSATLEFLRRAAAIIAQLLDSTLSSDELTAPTDSSLNPLRRNAKARTKATKKLRPNSGDPARQNPQEMAGNSAPLQEPLRQPPKFVTRFTVEDIVHNKITQEDGRIVRIAEDLGDHGLCYIVSIAPDPALGVPVREVIWRQLEVTRLSELSSQ